MTHSRRDFLISGLASGAAIPTLNRSLWSNAASMAPRAGRKLVIIQVDGGWDYFNQIVPVYSSTYYNARPNVAVDNTSSATLPISSKVPEKWASFASAWRELFDRGDLAVINNVGYPEPDQSHFESQSRWYTGKAKPNDGDDGWLGKYLTQAYTGTSSIPAIDASATATGAFDGARVPVIGSTTTGRFGFETDYYTSGDNLVEVAAMEIAASVKRTTSESLAYTSDVMSRTFRLVQLLQNAAQYYQPKVQYPYNVDITPYLYRIAGLLTQNFPSHVYYLRTGAYDHHTYLAGKGGTTGQFADAIRALSGNIKAFLDDMKLQGRGQEVVVLVFSEFSRRFGENGSQGLDHGHGGVAYVAGEPVIGGYFGKYPDLAKVTTPYEEWFPDFDKDSTDFRRVYASILDKWLGVSSPIVLGSQFATLPIL
ncbi:MAG: DUF1501 domain-containing protein [Planctomycetes bacterium]|nr:DUF1501 domain-containing protein [Planctomycetota bacterium]